MGKKVDLSTRRNNSNFRKSKHNFNYYNNPQNLSQEDINTEEVQNINNKNHAYLEREYELPKKANLTITMPIPARVTLIAAIIGIPFLLLIGFIVIFYDESQFNGNGKYKLGQTCTTVTVKNTENYIYDGEVSFDDYIAGVVAAESNGSTNIEYLKLLATTARTDAFSNLSSSCTVEGNSNFYKYIDVDDSSNSELVKQAIEATKDLVLTKNEELIEANYNKGCVINVDSNYYYLRYNSNSIQKIPKTWAQTNGVNSILDSLYSQVDKSEQDYQKRECPENTYDDGISQIGAIYLITNQGYNYEEVIKYYNDTDVEITKNEINHVGKDGFINPTETIYCSSPYGYRTHPVSGEASYHSGLDIGVAAGTPIYAAKSGTITRIETDVTAINNCNYGYGNYIVIDHGDGSSTLYAHMKYGSISDSISDGSQISQGEQIGEVGSTGCSTGNHLHYEVLINNSTVDPADYLDLTNASGTCKR